MTPEGPSSKGLPAGWQRCTVGDLAAPSSYSCVGGPFGSDLTAKDYRASGVPVIRGANLGGSTRWLRESGFVFVSPEKADQLQRNMAFPGDLIFTQRGTLGQVARVPLSARYPAYLLSQSQMKLAPDLKRADPDFLYFFFTSAIALREIERCTIGTGVPHLNLTILKSLSVVLPTLAEQRKIAAILSSVDETIEKTEAVIAQLDVVKKAMLEELLTRGIPGRHSRFKQTEIGEVPASWELGRLGDAAVPGGLQTGPFGSQLKAEEYSEHGIPVVMPRDMIGGRVDFSVIARVPVARAEDLSRHRLILNDIVFARRGDIGRCALVTEREVGWLCGTGSLRARLGRGAVARFVVHYLGTPFAVGWLTENAVGQTMLNLNTDILARLPILLPPVEEQELIADAIDAIDGRFEQERACAARLGKVKESLSAALLSGDLRVLPGDR